MIKIQINLNENPKDFWKYIKNKRNATMGVIHLKYLNWIKKLTIRWWLVIYVCYCYKLFLVVHLTMSQLVRWMSEILNICNHLITWDYSILTLPLKTFTVVFWIARLIILVNRMLFRWICLIIVLGIYLASVIYII